MSIAITEQENIIPQNAVGYPKIETFLDEQIAEEVNKLLAKMTPLQALEALQNLNK